MKFKNKLLEGILLQRYKRFFADVEYKGETHTIHVPNTGSLKAVIDKSAKQKCWFSLHGDETKKLKGTLEAIQTTGGVWVGVNTSNPNKIVQEAIYNSLKTGVSHFSHWSGYNFYKPEYKISKETRLDGVLYKNESDLENTKIKKHFIEIKNTTYVENINGKTVAMFPDAVTARGQKHLRELMSLIEQGHSAELIFTIQRHDAMAFSAAKNIDPEYARLLNEAKKKGLIITPAIAELDRVEVNLTTKLARFMK